MTKYVFDKDKHLYGATNLNIPRNQEPNSLTINPANVHEPYKPYVPERLDNINMPKDPSFNPTIYSPRPVNPNLTASNNYNPRSINPGTYTAGGATHDDWGSDATFNISESKYRSYDGWTENTQNKLMHTLGTTIGPSSGKGYMKNGNDSSGGRWSTSQVTAYPFVNIWNPYNTFTSTVQYGDLGTPPASNPYYVVSNNAHDNIKSRTNSWPIWFTSGHTGNVTASSIETSFWHYYRDDNANSYASRDRDIHGANTSYNYFWNHAEEDTNSSSPTHGQWRIGNSGTYTYPDRLAAVNAAMLAAAGTPNWNDMYNSYAAYNYGNPGNLGNSGLFRDTLVYNDTADTTLQNLNVEIGNNHEGGSFAKIKDKKYTVKNIEVKLIDGNGTAGSSAAYIIDTGKNGGSPSIVFDTTDKANKVYSTDNSTNNIAFNFQNGDVTSAATSVGVTGPVDVVFVGNNNTVYRVSDYIKKATIINGDGATDNDTGLKADNLTTKDNLTTGTGRIWLEGNNNIVYDGIGYVDGDGTSANGKLYLSDAQIMGSNNAIVALRSGAGQTQGSQTAVGAFEGDIKLQGAIGNGSENSVAVYAASGQGSGIRKNDIVSILPSTDLKPVKITDFNVGIASDNHNNKISKKNTLVYATNGTEVDVSTTTKPYGTSGEAIISEALVLDSGVNRKYSAVTIDKVGENTVIGHATGVFNRSSGYTSSGIPPKNPSRIVFDSQVDMVSQKGIAYLADDSGSIKAKATRAGGYQSIIAYADGTNAVGSINPKQIEIDGDIAATDYLVLDSTKYGPGIGSFLQYTYQNVGAYAKNGGTIYITGTAAATDVQESATANTATTGKLNKSLIYGMGAYASGSNGSIGSYVEMKNVSVVSGKDGALYATNKGKITYEGKILNQNNKTLSGSGDITLPTGTDATFTGTRKGQTTSLVTDNDHENVSPFYVYRINDNDNASITFSGSTATATKIDMYDGILLTGNVYNNGNKKAGDSTNSEWDYANSAWAGTVDKGHVYDIAKYKNMDHVTANILKDGVTVGIINQADKEINWNIQQNWGTGTGAASGNFLSGIGEYAGGLNINNSDKYNFDVSLINSKLKVTKEIDLEDKVRTRTGTQTNDPFNNIKMESTKVTLAANVTGDVRGKDRITKGVHGDNYQLENVGLSMANTLFRWDDVYKKNSAWRKTKNTESGFWVEANKNVTITGGQKDNPVTALNVSYGTIDNSGILTVDHGNGMVGTDNSILNLAEGGTITISGKYDSKVTPALSGGSENYGEAAENDPTGANYGIVGISRKDTKNYSGSYTIDGSSVDTDAIKISSAGVIKVDGGESVDGAVTATGIYAKNVNAAHNNVTINYDDDNKNKSAGIEVQVGSKPGSRGVGIALVNDNPNGNGGVITLKGYAGDLGSGAANKNNIVTKENGIGIYGENADIILKSDKFTITTKDDGVGIWVTDNAKIAENANHTKTFEYNYDGKNNKNGFAMAFGGRNTGTTHASNDLDIKFSNHAENPVDLAYEQAKSKVAAVDGGTYKGIAGILVNTNDGADTVTNRGNIEEDKSKTNVRAYGAVVNKGTFVNYGNIKLKDSLDHQASQITSEDMKKVNVGIFANSTNKLDTTITNRGDITIGDSTNNKNIGSWAIYGYNVNTDSKEDGSKSKITINRNNYGIYSGDGNVNIKNTKLLVGNDTVLGHVQTTAGVSTAPGAYPISRQTTTAGSVNGYSDPNDLLSGLDKPRELDSAIGVYIDKGSIARDINVSADMDIDRFSFGIVMAEKNGGPTTNVTIGSPTDAPTIVLASNKNAGGQVKSTAPSNPKVPEETKEQGNSVYYYSADTESRGKSYANVSMNGDYNTAYYTKGSMDNYGTIDLRSKYDVDNNNVARGYGNVGIFSANTSAPSTNYGKITTGMSDTVNMQYSAAMAAGRNHYKTDGNFDKTTEEGYIVNRGDIYVKEKEGIGMFATGAGSKAINYGNIHLEGESAIGMYLDRGAIGENYGEIEGNAQSLKGVVAINGGYIKNYGHITVTGSGSYGIVTDGSRFIVDANGNPTEVLQSTDSRYTSTSAVTAGQTNRKGGTDLYGGTESSIEEGTSGNPKTTGVGTTITAPDIVPITKVSVDGIDTPIFNVESDAANPGDWAKTVTVSSSIQTGGTRIIDLSAKNEWGNPVWEHAYKDPLSEVTSIGMYVDTSGVRYTNPIDGIQNLPKLGKVDLYFGPEATLYTNSKAIRIGDKVDANGTVTKSNILKPFNDALSRLPGGAKVNVLSGSLTWQVLAKLDSNNQLSEIYMSKVPYHSFAYDNDKSLVNFTNNLDNIYEIAKPQSAEKVIFNKLNSLGNGEGHILAQAFDQMRGHIYGGVQQRIKSTSDILTGEMNGLRSDRNVSKDSNKFKAFGQRNEFKTDTAGMPDWYSNAGGFAFVHEDETVRLGQSSGWSAGVVNNYFTFKDLSKSYENQAMAKVGVFKTIPLDANGTFVLSLGGDGFFGRNDMKRRFWVVDQEFRAKASYYSYGAGLNAGLEKAFVINDGFSIVPNVGIRAEYGRFSSIHENGDMALNVKSDDYVSVKPSAGIDFRYSQEVFKNSNLTASLGFAYENEIGKLYDVENEARIVGAWTDYFGIRGDKEDKRGNFKSDLKLGLDNGRFGFNVNTGYDSKGHNFRAGLGLKVLY
ncbi:autotransporter outer membrane beta-barrel domain-containing protein [Leptotrichia wadei]|uniref:autotransporter outer membrane beta-barrel domain-containing protein n=1 Tax=Leptotrichia wadei TaxID=157687 RepID=UPI0028E59C72|nr:autotransporter outer membrane beta-barrel domain-containing protein [Leptotrichia wadei]